MRKGKFYSKIGFFISVVLLVFLFSICTVKAEKDVNKDEDPLLYGGSDLILIDAVGELGAISRPPVVFFHGRHTDALLKAGRDCTTCHLADDNSLSPKFMRLTDSDRNGVMQVYHTNCIGCHSELTVSKEVGGPVTCGGCHDVTPSRYESFWKPIKFNKHLHYTHVKANDEKCEFCHHEYDKKTEKLVYKKGNENPCSYCHGNETVDRVVSMRCASHESCIGCHRDRKSKYMRAGPVDCIGCHDDSKQASIKKFDTVPRLDRGQPDEVLVKTGTVRMDDLSCSACMQLVPFDHKSHELHSDTCIVCHHASLESCSKCHTNVGNDEGEQVRLADAMHRASHKSSCIGCHKVKQEDPDCAGCHSKPESIDLCASSCDGCHVVPVLAQASDPGETETQHLSIAEEFIGRRVFETKIFDEKDIPETVSIGNLEDQYKPVNFPHRKIVLKLLDRVKNSKLAAYFHCDQGTLCLGCHHNSPISRKPPACGNCHGDKVDISMPFKPRLVSAYHQQCIRCHDAMGLKDPDSRNCSACHTKKDAK